MNMQKKQRAHDLMKQGQSVRGIMEITGLSEVEVLGIQKEEMAVTER